MGPVHVRPNILFLFPDQLRHDFIGSAGRFPVNTPAIDRIAERGTRFSRAISPSPLCAPARACIAAGVEYERCGVAANGESFPLDRRSVYRVLRDSGYTVLGCGKFDLHKPEYSWGPTGTHLLDEWGFSAGVDNEGKIDGVAAAIAGTPGPYLTYLEGQGSKEAHVRDFSARETDLVYDALTRSPLSSEDYCDNWIARNGLELLDTVPVGEPWFLQVNFAGPHSPFDVTEEMASWYRDTEFPCPSVAGYDSNTIKNVWRNYAAMITNIDRWTAVYLDALERRGELENTLIVFASDHGEMLGERASFGKRQPYHASLGVPLVVAGPGIQSGRVLDVPTTILDLSATFLEAAGVAVPSEMDSRPLTGVLSGDKSSVRDYVCSGLDNWSVVMDDRYKLISWDDGRTELYNIDADPSESSEISDAEPAVVERLLRLRAHR